MRDTRATVRAFANAGHLSVSDNFCQERKRTGGRAPRSNSSVLCGHLRYSSRPAFQLGPHSGGPVDRLLASAARKLLRRPILSHHRCDSYALFVHLGSAARSALAVRPRLCGAPFAMPPHLRGALLTYRKIISNTIAEGTISQEFLRP